MSNADSTLFQLAPEQVHYLTLDEDRPWWGFPMGRATDEDRHVVVTEHESAALAVEQTLDTGIEPPPEFAAWAASVLLHVPGWPEDWG